MGVILNIAARELGISERTLDSWARSGRIGFTRSAGGWRLFDSMEIARVKAQIINAQKPGHIRQSGKGGGN